MSASTLPRSDGGPSTTPRRAVLLAVSPVYPWPIRDGMTLRIGHLLEELAHRWRVVLASPAPEGTDPDEGRADDGRDLAAWLPAPVTGSASSFPTEEQTAAFRSTLGGWLEHHTADAALLWPATEEGALSVDALPPAGCDRVDSVTLAAWRSRAEASGLRESLSSVRRAAEAAMYERRLVRKSEVTFAVGEDDARTLAWLGGARRVHTAPNGVEPPASTDADDRADVPLVSFTGTLGFPPNVTAARYLARKVWPLVRSRIGSARLVIAGRSPVEEVRQLGSLPGVEVWPDVPDMADVHRRTWVSVAPMLSGSGIKNKVLEAWAAGTPVVMTSLATNGLRLPPSSRRLVVDEPSLMARRVTELLHDEDELARVGDRCRRTALRHHTWDGAAGSISRALGRAAGLPVGPGGELRTTGGGAPERIRGAPDRVGRRGDWSRDATG